MGWFCLFPSRSGEETLKTGQHSPDPDLFARINQPILLGKVISYFKVEANYSNSSKLNSSIGQQEA